MSYTFKFSVGKLKIGANYVAPATGITISCDGSPVDNYAGDHRYPLAIELGNQSCEISIECLEFGLENFPGDDGGSPADFLNNSLVDLTLEAGPNGGGIVGTIVNCKVTSYEVVSAQDDFVRATITLRKVQKVV